MVIGCLAKAVFFPMKSPRKFALLSLAALAALVVFQNFGQTELSLLFWSGEMPLVILILFVLLTGISIGYLLGWKKPPRRAETKTEDEVSPSAKYQ